MMNIQVVKGRTMKTVTLTGMPNDSCEVYALSTALEAARETKSSIFGHRVNFYSDDEGIIIAVVELHID